MASPCKKRKSVTGAGCAETGFIRVCDAFVRTVGDVISPCQKSEESVRVMFKLQRELLQTLMEESASEIAGLRLRPMEWEAGDPEDSAQQIDGNIFMPYEAAERVDEASFERFRNRVTTELKQQYKVKNTLIDKLQTKSIILQPMISERDFDLHKIKLCHERLLKAAGLDLDNNALAMQADNIKTQLEELKGTRIKIGFLSHNGRGKSFILNLLFWLTADTDQEYETNNEKINLLKDIKGDPKIKELLEEDMEKLPQMIQDVIVKIRSNENNKSNEKHYKDFADTFVKRLDSSTDQFCYGLKNYLTGAKIDVEPYILAQKGIKRAFDSTTKCIIHLRYDPLYQMKVEYFSTEDLQYQLFELRSIIEEGTSEGTCSDRKKTSHKTLKARLALLTGLIQANDANETVREITHTWKNAEDIKLSSDVMEYAGTTEMYIGNGRNATSDRLAIRDLLKSLTTSQERNIQSRQEYITKRAAVKKIVVYLPSKILIGREILEMPGIDESDPLAIDCINSALDSVDVVFLLSEFALKIAESEVKKMLGDSTFFQRMLDSSNYKLMLLAYPEKQCEWQLGLKDEDKIRELEQEEKEKRIEEIETLEQMLRDRDLPFTMTQETKESIYTSYILPVLHTSLHLQAGVCQEIIENYKTFLKHTGVTKLMTELDKFATKKQKESVLEIKDRLEEMPREANGELDVESAIKVVSLIQDKEWKSTFESQLAKKNEGLLTNLRKCLMETIYKFVDEQILPLLTRSIPEATQRWNDNDDKITSIGAFNPYFNGNHPAYKVKIKNILFEGITDEAKEHFPILITGLKEELSKYEKEAITLLTAELDSLLPSKPGSTQQFVESAVKEPLKDATDWYMGKIKLPFNKKKLEECFVQSLKTSLKYKLLQPEIPSTNFSEDKEILKKRIPKTLQDVKEQFQGELIRSLHEKRFKSLCGKLKDRKGNSRMWQLLMGKIKCVVKNKELIQQLDEINAAIKLMSINLGDDPE